MAGEQKRIRRASLVAKALLLGYTFEVLHDPRAGRPGLYRLVGPDGKKYPDHTKPSAAPFAGYPSRWSAAQAALRISGVPYET